MSKFEGVFAHLPGVSCDRFNGANLESDQFFLSHCHADHMVGLDSENFHQKLASKNHVKVNNKIYCSAISKTFILKKFAARGLDSKWICVLPHNSPRTVNVFNKAKAAMFKLRVTAIPANHCPGSVMFLFEAMQEPPDEETPEWRILYTGDFRFEEPFDLSSLQALHDPHGNVIRVDEMFLDTTFASNDYKSFPSREEALVKIWDKVQGWVRKNGLYKRARHKHVVLLRLPAQFGSEAILKRIFENSGNKWKIHVGTKKFAEYLCTEDLGNCTSSDTSEAQWVHACSWEFRHHNSSSKERLINRLPCQGETPFEVLDIRPSAMWFKKELAQQVIKCTGGDSYRVCYSCHSSLTELRQFVAYFQPKRVTPCVIPRGLPIPEGSSGVREVLELLTTPHYKPEETEESSDGLRSISSPSNSKSPAVATSGSQGDSQMDFLENFCSPQKAKRKFDSKADNECGGGPSPAKRPAVVNTMASGMGKISPSISISGSIQRKITFSSSQFGSDSSNSDDEDGRSVAKKKRKSFQRSKMMAHSMPVHPSDVHADLHQLVSSDSFQQNGRRASLPHNLKIPHITITPSSPSPDPNHPDYPEFFEDKMYLESYKSVCSLGSSSDSNSNSNAQPQVAEGPVSSGDKIEAPSTEPSPTTPSTSACNKQLLGGLDANTKKELMTSAEEMPPPPPTMSVSSTTSMMKQQGKSGLVRQHSISAFKTNQPDDPDKSRNPFTSKSSFETTSMSSDCGPSSDDLYKKVFGASEPENLHEPNHQPDNPKKPPQDTHNQNTDCCEEGEEGSGNPLDRTFVEEEDELNDSQKTVFNDSQPLSDTGSVVCIGENVAPALAAGDHLGEAEDDDDQSTPDFETVLATCKNPTERANCVNFIKSKSRHEKKESG